MTARSGRFTADQLGEVAGLPDTGLRREVLDGRLVVAPPQPRRHDRVVENLASRLWHALPGGVQVRGGVAVRLPDGDGPVPDLVVATAHPPQQRILPAADVCTVVEVVTEDGRYLDRVWKRRIYADAGIPCYWRVEVAAGATYRGPLPVVVVRWREAAGWRELVAAAGRLHTLPLAIRCRPGRPADTVAVQLDPGDLTVRHATTW